MDNFFSGILSLLPGKSLVEPAKPKTKIPTLLDGPLITFKDIKPEVVKTPDPFTPPVFTRSKPPERPITESFPGTVQGLAGLQVDPLSLKANPRKIVSDFVENQKSATEHELQAAADFISSFNKGRSVSEKVGKGIKLGAASAGLLFAPITGLFKAAENVPILGSAAKLVNTAFSALGESVTSVSDHVIDSIPDQVLSRQAKDNIKPAIGEIAALASQIYVGGKVESILPSERGALKFRNDFTKANPEYPEVNNIGANQINRLTKKYGPEDTSTIIKKSIEISREKKAAEAQAIPQDARAGFARIPESGKPDIKAAEVELAKTEPPAPDATSRLITAIGEAGKSRSQLERAYSEERAKRAGAVEAMFKEGEGKEGYFKALGKLKGELTEKPTFDAIKLEATDVNDLFNRAQSHPTLTPFEKIRVQDGLMKLMDGEVPQEGQLALMEKVYGKQLVDTVLSKRPNLTKFKEVVAQILNIPRTVMSSFDLSFGGRQGVFAAPKFRKQFWSAWKKQFKMFGDEKAFQAAQENITKNPNYDLAKESGVAFTDIGDKMSIREERFMSSWAEKIPVLGRGVKGSARAYTAFANKFRMDIFDSLVKDAELQGLSPRNDIALSENIAKLVNAMTGRGALGKKMEAAAPLLNALFFSPRLIASRLTLLNPAYYVMQDAFVRKQAIQSLLSFAGTITTILTVANLAGADVETDPRSSDFAKIKVGNTRIDIMGGFQQYAVLAARLFTGESKSASSGKITKVNQGYKPVTRLDFINQAIINKEAPVMSFITALLRGQNAIGEKVNVPAEIANRFTPMILGDIYDILQDNPALAPVSLLGIFGAGIQTYKPAKKAVPAGTDDFFSGSLKLGK